MEAMREAWTDDRLDDLNRKVDAGFRAVDKRLDGVDRRLDRIDGRLDRLDDRLASMQFTLVLFCGGAIAALIGVIASILATGA